jgi:hypothetical protein
MDKEQSLTSVLKEKKSPRMRCRDILILLLLYNVDNGTIPGP